MLPISVCFIVGLSMATWHIFLRSSSVRVFRGTEFCTLGAWTRIGEGATMGGMLMGGADCEEKLFGFVNMLGHVA